MCCDNAGQHEHNAKVGHHSHNMLHNLIHNSPQANTALHNQQQFHNTIYGHLTHLALISSDLWVIDLVATHAGVPPLAISQTTHSGSLQALELLVHHFVDHHLSAAPVTPVLPLQLVMVISSSCQWAALFHCRSGCIRPTGPSPNKPQGQSFIGLLGY
jgi:hypothetical protein